MPLMPKHWRTTPKSGQACGHGKPCGRPGIVRKAGRYTASVARWIAAGRPTRSQDEIDALLAICQGCEHFSAEASACRLCGCNLNNQRSGLTNKLAMATEHCPDTPPRWT